MSYYTIRQSTPQGTGQTPVTFSGQNPAYMTARQTPAGGFRTRTVTPESTVSHQLGALLSSDSPYIQRARNSSANFAAGRGLLNSTMAAGAGEAAAIDSALPIATTDAGTYAVAEADNMDAENTYLRQQADLANAFDLARLQAGTQSEIAALSRDENARQFDQEFDEGRRRYDVDYQRSIDDLYRTNQLSRNNFIQSGIFQTIFSDPSIWRDPEGAMGFANYYGQNFASLWDSIFPSASPTPAMP